MKIKTIEAHTGGEPLRIIIDGYPKLMGKTILDKRKDALLNYDHIRKAIIWEPRGHQICTELFLLSQIHQRLI